jgi:CDP-glycerol glycerophosphotransferase
LADMPAMVAQYGDRYAAWSAKFNAWDDGHASQRVVDAVFG